MLGLLVCLAALNVVWAVISVRSGPIVGGAMYALVAVLCQLRRDYRAVVVVAMIGFAIHALTLVRGVGSLGSVELGLLVANILLPVPLAYFGWRLARLARSRQASG